MEALAGTATVVQLSIYASNVASALYELLQIIRNGPVKLHERGKRLEILEVVVKKIEQDNRLHSKQVKEYLIIVRSNILRLYGVILHKLQNPRDTFARKLRAGFALLLAEKRIDEAFASLGQDCHYLTLYLSEYDSNPTMAQNSNQQIPQFDQQGEYMPADARELSLLPRKPTLQHREAVSPPISSGEQLQATADTASTGPIFIGQSFKKVFASGSGVDGRVSSNDMGSVRAAALQGGQLKQEYEDIVAESGGQNKMGNIV